MQALFVMWVVNIFTSRFGPRIKKSLFVTDSEHWTISWSNFV